MSKEITWNEVKNKFLKFSKAELKLPVLTGGGSYLFGFYGFPSIGPIHKENLTGKDVLELLNKLNEEDLKKVVSNEYTDKFGIGINKVCISHELWVDEYESGEKYEDNEYNVMQDYLGGTLGCHPSFTEVKKQFNDDAEVYKACKYEPQIHELIEPGKAIIIEITDGACLLDDSDLLI